MIKHLFMPCLLGLIPLASMAQENRTQMDEATLGNYHLDMSTDCKVQGSHENGTTQIVNGWRVQDNALWVSTSGGTLRVEPLQGGSIRVTYGTETAIKAKGSYAVTEKPQTEKFKVKDKNGKIILSATTYKLTIDKQQGYITLLNAESRQLLSEMLGGARLNVVGDSVKSLARFTLTPTEHLYGLGQYRDRNLNLRNTSRELVQMNTQAAVPVVYSTAGWGLFWDNPSRTIYTDDKDGMTFESDWGKVVDYYLFTGATMDELIASYRQLTGQMPMLPYWALGYHQSRNRYATTKELEEVAKKMKELKVPMGSIFIDYHHWGKYGTGSFRFDETMWPDMPQFTQKLRDDYDTHSVVTVWPCFKPGTDNYNTMHRQGFLLEGARAIDGIIYDAYNPKARKQYFELFRPMLKTGIDGWFLDGPEPDHVPTFLPTVTHDGPAQSVRNVYPIVHTGNFYNAMTQEMPGKRQYILTRCGWASQQKYGSAIWSGDIPATMDELGRQVVAGLNFTATGIPFWTTDIGGYDHGDPDSEEYREVFARWFEWGTFCPVFRAHGRRVPFDTTGPNEIWSYGPEVQKICTDYINLRYRLMPYVYSLAGWTTLHAYTPMRHLAFDFADDAQALHEKYELMYGPSLLVCPVTETGKRSREVYLPKGTDWVDYWTGKSHKGGTRFTADAPLNRIPLYVKAGAIIPQHLTPQTKPNNMAPLEIAVYDGADGSFDLYEDDGTTTRYEQGEYTLINMVYDARKRTFSMKTTHGQAAPRSITVVLKQAGKGDVKKTIEFDGNKSTIKL